ncbi:hypothetical protein JAAARDRAFT_341950 [Jaapia argillacea MUCL 33604]|uniref:Uncharacterized protein n=1 Tax=Jaapia argillacea MUCL 33604 TaxID=933084 RepID=A0A067PXR2_9AGAM|nr:hypothetical protein JAAARDRAFT_341950 [Jaapia argillacea MUCL 33604]
MLICYLFGPILMFYCYIAGIPVDSPLLPSCRFSTQVFGDQLPRDLTDVQRGYLCL